MDQPASVISIEEAGAMIQSSGFGGVGLPRLINSRTLGGENYV